MKQHEFQQSVLTMQKSVTITVTPQRSNSLDYLNFEEKRQLIASSLSLSDILSNQVGPAVAQAAKDVAAASSVIGKIRTFRDSNRKKPRISIFISRSIRSLFLHDIYVCPRPNINFNFSCSSEKTQRHDSPDDQPKHRHPNASTRKKKQIQRSRATFQAMEMAPKKEKRKVWSCVKMWVLFTFFC